MNASSSATDVFPNRLRLARERRGLNQADLAKRSGLQVTAISHFETGTRKPSFDNLKKLADALDVATDYLLGRTDDFDASTGVARLNRHGSNLSADDLDLMDQFRRLLEDRNRS